MLVVRLLALALVVAGAVAGVNDCSACAPNGCDAVCTADGYEAGSCAHAGSTDPGHCCACTGTKAQCVGASAGLPSGECRAWIDWQKAWKSDQWPGDLGIKGRLDPCSVSEVVRCENDHIVGLIFSGICGHDDHPYPFGSTRVTLPPSLVNIPLQVIEIYRCNVIGTLPPLDFAAIRSCGFDTRGFNCPIPPSAKKCFSVPGYWEQAYDWDWCQACPSGKHLDGFVGASACRGCHDQWDTDDCVDCPAGQFSTRTPRCSQCPDESLTKLPTECKACPGGRTSEAGATLCPTECVAGTFSTPGSLAGCVNCPAGQITATSGQGACTLCPSGWFSGSGGSHQCEPTKCPPGMASLPGATRKDECIAECRLGQYVEDGKGCVSCPAGQYLGASGCAACPSGCCNTVASVTYTPITGCTEQCATELGGGGTQTVRVSSGYNPSTPTPDWSLPLGTTMLAGPSIKSGDGSMAVTLLTSLGDNQWLLGAVDLEPQPAVLKLVKIQMTGASTFRYVAANYQKQGEHSDWAKCIVQETFTYTCFTSASHLQAQASHYTVVLPRPDHCDCFSCDSRPCPGCDVCGPGKPSCNGNGGNGCYSSASRIGCKCTTNQWLQAQPTAIPTTRPPTPPPPPPTPPAPPLNTTVLTGSLVGPSPGHASIPITLRASLDNSQWVLGAVDGTYLKMVQIEMTGASTFRWLGAKYQKPGEQRYATCIVQATFTPDCFTSTEHTMPDASHYTIVLPPPTCASIATVTMPCNNKPCDLNYNTSISHMVPDSFRLPVRNQGRCGGCYAFASADVYGARLQHFMKQQRKTLTRFPSAQWLLSCGGAFAKAACAQTGDDCGGGCSGGFSIMAMEFMATRGVATSSADGTSGCVPFSSTDGTTVAQQCAAFEVPDVAGEACCQGGLSSHEFFFRDFKTCAADMRGPLLKPRQRGHCFSFNSVGWTPFMQYNIRREIQLNGPVTATMLVCESFHDFFGDPANAGKVYDQDCTPAAAADPTVSTEICASPVDSPNGGKWPRGCAGAVFSDGSPSHSYCSGSLGGDTTNNAALARFYSTCCTWDSTSGCVPKVGTAAVGYHEVVIVGWGVDNSTTPHMPYWHVKNSWGADWGDEGYFKIKRGANTSGIEGSVCMISPETEVELPHFRHNPRGNMNLADCGYGDSAPGASFEAQNEACDLGPLRAAGGWVPNAAGGDGQYHAAVHAAAAHAVAAHARRARKLAASSSDTASVPAHTVLASHSQSVAGVNRRVLVRVGDGADATVLEARVHRDARGTHSLLAEATEHSCAEEPAQCTAHADCCGAGGGADANACGTCIASKMAAELAPPPPSPTAAELQAQAKAEGQAEGRAEGKAEGEAKGKAEGRAEGEAKGALVGSLATLGACAAALLAFNGAKRVRARRGAAAAASGYSSGTRAPTADSAGANAEPRVEGANPGAGVVDGSALNEL